MVPEVRYPACYAPHPFLVPACIAAATLGVDSLMQVFFKSEGDVLELDSRVGVKQDMASEYRARDVFPRWFISISETLLPRASRWVLTTGSTLAVVWSWTCYPNPAYASVVTVIAVAFNVVGYTRWTSFEHEMATSMLSIITLGVQLTESIVFILPREGGLFIALVTVQLLLCAFFALHVPVTGCIYKLEDENKRNVRAWWERERLTLGEWLNVAWFVLTACLV